CQKRTSGVDACPDEDEPLQASPTEELDKKELVVELNLLAASEEPDGPEAIAMRRAPRRWRSCDVVRPKLQMDNSDTSQCHCGGLGIVMKSLNRAPLGESLLLYFVVAGRMIWGDDK
ncbi:hypothetical protein PR002_g29933, partial [Phytophthora rubi]